MVVHSNIGKAAKPLASSWHLAGYAEPTLFYLVEQG
jgi:hypothetical protein